MTSRFTPGAAGRVGFSSAAGDDDDDDDYDDYGGDAGRRRRWAEEARRADHLSTRLLAIDDDDEGAHDRILRESLDLPEGGDAGSGIGGIGMDMDGGGSTGGATLRGRTRSGSSVDDLLRRTLRASQGNLAGLTGVPSARRLSHSAALLGSLDGLPEALARDWKLLDAQLEAATARRRLWGLILLAVLGLAVLAVGGYALSVRAVGPPNQPVGAYELVELQEGSRFFDFYTFYEGRDSAGSAGFNTYVGVERAQALGIVNVTMEVDELDTYGGVGDGDGSVRARWLAKRRGEPGDQPGDQLDDKGFATEVPHPKQRAVNETLPDLEPFVYLASAPTADGPRESIRLEGNRRFNRGLFIIDVRHMPAGCGVWPAFWLTDEDNWPVNGEIDIVEGVNYQSQAKTALHATRGCSMDGDIPYGVMTGSWDTAQGIPDAKTGVPDMTMRYARNCFVYDPHQWLNQGCVAVSDRNDTLGAPLNRNGGGVFVLEWDPINRHIRSWAFSPHTDVPDNLAATIRTAHLPDAARRVLPDPELWPTPYAYFAVGEGTDCPAAHFRNMRLVLNTAFCGSVAGNRFQMDCPAAARRFETCNDYLRSDPEELREAYWKIRGVYVYQRQWERVWLT